MRIILEVRFIIVLCLIAVSNRGICNANHFNQNQKTTNGAVKHSNTTSSLVTAPNEFFGNDDDDDDGEDDNQDGEEDSESGSGNVNKENENEFHNNKIHQSKQNSSSMLSQGEKNLLNQSNKNKINSASKINNYNHNGGVSSVNTSSINDRKINKEHKQSNFQHKLQVANITFNKYYDSGNVVKYSHKRTNRTNHSNSKNTKNRQKISSSGSKSVVAPGAHIHQKAIQTKSNMGAHQYSPDMPNTNYDEDVISSKKQQQSNSDTLLPKPDAKRKDKGKFEEDSNFKDSREEQILLEREQDEETKKLRNLLSKLKFNNGATGRVKKNQEFSYISQCGLYTEPQNVSAVQHAWVTKTYSPYFYLYEKPRKYEKCKPSQWMNGTDMRGNVFLSFEVKSLHGSTMENNAKICEKYCCKEPRCAAWVLRLQSEGTSNCPPNSYCCWLKTDIPKPEPHEACVSGTVHRDHYKHPPNGMRSAVPLGALGSGSFELRADGTFHEWTIENQSPGGSAKLSKTSLDMMLLGVRVKKGEGKVHSAVLRTHAPHGYEGVESMQYSGSHPISRLKIDLKKSLRKDVDLNLYAYSVFHPRIPRESATPAVAFSLEITNPSSENLDVSFMLNLPFGYNDDTIRRGNNFAEVAFTRLVTAADCQKACAKNSKCMAWTTNGPFSCMLKDGMPLHAYEYGIISGLKGEWGVEEGRLNCKRPGYYAQSGDISLYPVNSDSEDVSFVVEDDPEVVWNTFRKSGYVSNKTSVNITGLNGAVSTRTKLRPKEKKLLTIIMSWYFPNNGIADERVGNFYNNLFKDSIDVSKHMEKDLTHTVEDVVNFQASFIPQLSVGKTEDKHSPKPKQKCSLSTNGIKTLPECLQDILMNSLSTLRTGMWMENGRWRQWEAFDCANMDPVHVDFHRIIPYVIMYPEIAKQLMLAWADHELENGMIQESLSMGCLEETSKEGVAGGRLMTDVNVGFIVQSYLIYSWTNDTSFFDEIYPFAKRAMEWLIKDSTKGTSLPYRKPDTYDLFELEKYDHCAYNSILYLLALNTMKEMSTLQKDTHTLQDTILALEKAEKRFDVEMWDEKREFYHAWFDDEWGSPSWLMSDVMYGQVWAYTLGIGDLLDKEKIRKHLRKEEKRNDSPYGIKAISKTENAVPLEDTSVILGDELNSCKSLENITKTESIWMSSSTDWSTLQLHLGLDPKKALPQAIKSLDNYRSTLRDQWNIHGLTSSQHYGLDGLPWATSHYTFHLVLWHLPLALSGQQYNAPQGKLTFQPKYEPPYWLPFYTPHCMGNIEAKEITNDGVTEIMYGFKVSSGECSFEELSIHDSKYSTSRIFVTEGETIKWSAPKKSKKDVVKEMLDQLKH